MIDPEFPTLKFLPPGLWRVEVPIVFDFIGFPKFTVPVGFETDGASVPRALWSLMPPMSSYSQAAIGHDYIYKNHDVVRNRKKADKFFLAAMVYLGVGFFKRHTLE